MNNSLPSSYQNVCRLWRVVQRNICARCLIVQLKVYNMHFEPYSVILNFQAFTVLKHKKDRKPFKKPRNFKDFRYFPAFFYDCYKPFEKIKANSLLLFIIV